MIVPTPFLFPLHLPKSAIGEASLQSPIPKSYFNFPNNNLHCEMRTLMNGKDVTVVQYLESSMSDQLLCKFPDNSAFDFEYSQSALWSPPIRRFHQLYQVTGRQILTPELITPKTPKSKSKSSASAKRRLSFDSDRRRKRITLSKIKKKIHSLALNFNLPKRRLKFNSSNDNGSHSPTANRKGWEKVLKVASKQFKRKKKKKDPTVHVKLSDYLRSENF